MKIIGIIGRGFRLKEFIRISVLMLVLFSAGVACGVSGKDATKYPKLCGKVYDYVDEWPTYNHETWSNGLTREFNKKFTYQVKEGEEIQTRIRVEMIVNKKGELARIRVINQPESRFCQEVFSCLRTCNNWSPGRINGKPVNTKIIWQLVY